MSAVRPFTFGSLPRLTRKQVALHQSVLAHLGVQVATADFHTKLEQVIGESLRAKCILSAPKIEHVAANTCAGLIPRVGTFAIIGMGPSGHKAIVDIDANLSAWAIERLLGGSGDDAAKPQRIQREPTELEFGVISYLVLRILDALGTGLADGQALAPVLDRLEGRSEALEDLAGQQGDLVALNLSLKLNQHAGYCRIFLPENFVDSHFGSRIDDSHVQQNDLPLMRRNLARLPHSHLTLRVVGAQLGLAEDDIANLEQGDIIVLEQHKLQFNSDGVSGEVTLKTAQGRNGHVVATIMPHENESQLNVIAIVEHKAAQGEDMADEPQDNLPETEGLLREMDASVAVELGRIRLNTAQVARLREGQVLKLARGGNDPVDLVIRGRVFGRGELVDVEGELGVRLTHITGEH